MADFIKAFGAVNVTQGDVYLGEESEEPGLILFPRDPVQRLSLGWKDPERKQDAGSGIVSWKGGKLADGFKQNWKVLVGAETSWELRISEMRKARNSDVITFESNSAEMQSANPWVTSIYVYF